MREPKHWDMDYDVVVAGYGYAGAACAITATDNGARAVILEKMTHFGGNSILSGGAMSVSDDADGALQYLRRTCLDTTDDEVLQVFAKGMVELPEMISSMSESSGFQDRVERRGGAYPFP